MTLTIGRTQIRAHTVEASGDLLAISGTVLPSSDATNAVKAARQQLCGYVDSIDEDAVPVQWTIDPSFDGWYRVRSASVVDIGPSPASIARADVTLERFGTAYAGIVLETVGTSVLRTNSESATAAAIWGIPGQATSFTPPGGWTKQLALASRTSADGALHIAGVDTSTGPVTGRYTVGVSAHYVGAATVETTYADGGTYYPVTGRHVNLGVGAWRLSNGLMRITPSATAGQLIEVSVFNGTTWSTATKWVCDGSYTTTPSASGTNPVFAFARVLRNSPEACTIRLGFRYTTASVSSSWPDTAEIAYENAILRQTQILDITLRRGDLVASFVTTNTPSPLNSQRWTLSGAPAGTAITGGVVQTSADASGNKAVLVGTAINGTPTTVAASTGAVGSTTPKQFGIGYEVPSGASAPHAAADIAQQWFGVIAEKQRTVLA